VHLNSSHPFQCHVMSCHVLSWLKMACAASPVVYNAIPYPTPHNPSSAHAHPLIPYLSILLLQPTQSSSKAIDWDHISKSTPPMKPSAKDINTATQSEIGSFQDEKISKKLILSEDDHKTYEKWEFLSKRSFQEEVVDFLTFEEKVVSFCFLLFSMFCFRFFSSSYMHCLRTVTYENNLFFSSDILSPSPSSPCSLGPN
jgi:hypothetical protein